MEYSLYHQFTEQGVRCIILAPSTMVITNTNWIKADKRDAGNIAICLALFIYSEVHGSTNEEYSIKEYIRMRETKKQLKENKVIDLGIGTTS